MKWNRKKGGYTAHTPKGSARIKKVLATEHRTTPKEYFRLSICVSKGAWMPIKTKGKDFSTLAGAKKRAETRLV